jgi:DNA-binding NarL/FixJ family response regulator
MVLWNPKWNEFSFDVNFVKPKLTNASDEQLKQAYDALTRRQQFVLGWRSCGKTLREIGKMLNVSGS